jgi:hypothetical protein
MNEEAAARSPHQDQGWHRRCTQWGQVSREGASPRGPQGEEPAPSHPEAGALQEAGQRPEMWQLEKVGGLPPAPTAEGGGCNKALPRPASSHLDKEKQALQFTTRAVAIDEGNVFGGGGDVPEGAIVVVPEVEIDPPRTESSEMERRGKKDTRVATK